jgi:aspartate 1-decarboxylase
MLISFLKSKISYAVVSQKDLYYVGSITIDVAIMDQAQLRENELVHIVNLNNGERLETYVIAGERGSGVIGLNGPAARCAELGDEIFILSYALIDPENEKIDPVLVDLKGEI